MSTFRRNIKIGTIDPLWGTEDIADKAITKAKLADDVIITDYDARIAALEQKQITCFNNCQIAEGTDSHTLNFRTYGSPKAVQLNSATSAKAGLMSTAQLAMLTNANDELTTKGLWAELNGKMVTFHNVVLDNILDGNALLTWKIGGVDAKGCTITNARGVGYVLVTPVGNVSMTIDIGSSGDIDTRVLYDKVRFTLSSNPQFGDVVDVITGGVSIVNKYTTKDMVGILKGFMDSAQKLVVFNVTEASGVYSATIEGTLPTTADEIKKTRFVAYISDSGSCVCDLSAAWTGSFWLTGIYSGAYQTKFKKIVINTSGGTPTVTVTELSF